MSILAFIKTAGRINRSGIKHPKVCTKERLPDCNRNRKKILKDFCSVAWLTEVL